MEDILLYSHSASASTVVPVILPGSSCKIQEGRVLDTDLRVELEVAVYMPMTILMFLLAYEELFRVPQFLRHLK